MRKKYSEQIYFAHPNKNQKKNPGPEPDCLWARQMLKILCGYRSSAVNKHRGTVIWNVESRTAKLNMEDGSKFLLVIHGLSLLNPQRKNLISYCFYSVCLIHTPVNMKQEYSSSGNFAVDYYGGDGDKA